VTRNVTFTKDAAAPQRCRNSVKTIEPNSDEYRVTETYDFDAFGNIHTSTVVGRQPAPGGGFMDMPARVTTVVQNATGITPDVITDPMNLSIGYGFNANAGTLQKVVDPNSTPSNVIETSYVYDEFGRRTRQNNHEGTYRTWTYQECATSGGCISTRHVLTIVESLFDSQGALIRTDLVYADRMDRSLVSLGRQLNGTTWDGSYSWSEQEFDEFGRVTKTFMPCSTTAITTTCRSAATTYSYDLMNRVVAETRPRSALDSNLQSTTHAFSGRTLVTVDALGKSTTRVVDPQGSLRYLLDANGYGLTFAYDAAGTLVATTDSEGVPKLSGVTVEYGTQAFPVTSTDPALGSRARTFNSLGELIAWTDAKGQTFSATYDKLSRLVTRTDPDAVTTWACGTTRMGRNRFGWTDASHELFVRPTRAARDGVDPRSQPGDVQLRVRLRPAQGVAGYTYVSRQLGGVSVANEVRIPEWSSPIRFRRQ
jgi:YD repeat-containing protein